MISDQNGPTEKSGPPRKVDLLFRKISGRSEPFHSVSDRNFRKFWLNGKRPSQGPPFEVDRFFRLVRSDRKSLFHSQKFRFAVPLCRTFWKFLSETEWNGSVHPGWYNHPENFPIYCSICHVKFSKSQTGIFGRMESARSVLRGGGEHSNSVEAWHFFCIPMCLPMFQR